MLGDKRIAKVMRRVTPRIEEELENQLMDRSYDLVRDYLDRNEKKLKEQASALLKAELNKRMGSMVAEAADGACINFDNW